jgi:16S rRNA (cytosine967-C5)-methyltransferase
LVRDGVPFDAALTQALGDLPPRDRRLAHELAAGTVRTAAVLDRALASHVARGLTRVPPDLHELLRLGSYQLTALDRVPAHAAVATSVALARERHGSRAAGFVNAVLRRVAAEAPRTLPGRGSHPGWLVGRWTRYFGPEETAQLLRWNDTRPRLVAQPARWTLGQLLEAWHTAGIGVTEAPYGAGLVPEISRPRDLPGYAEGGFVIQDPAQRLVMEFFALPPGVAAYDACAAPGGKSIAAGRQARLVIAGEYRRERARRLAANLARAGSGHEHVVVADALHPPVRPVNVVLLDVPCLGTGVLARHPEARWRAGAAGLDRLVEQGRAMLRAVADRVKPGGWLCFSTCSLEPEENDAQIDAFLAEDHRFRRDPGPAPGDLMTPAGDLMTLPQRHGVDGAYAARLRRIA